MRTPTDLQILLGLNALNADIRVVVQSAAAIVVMLYALSLRRRSRRVLQAWPIMLVGFGLAIDVFTPLLGANKLASWADSIAAILFMCGVVRVALELADAASHRGREHFSTIFRDLLTLAIWVVVVMVVLRTFFNVDITALLAIPVVITGVIGLALQETLGNIFSGLTLQISKPFQPGDWVRSADKVGRVQGVGWRATTIVTRNNERLEVPNGQIAKEVLFNYANSAVADEVSVGISYDCAPNHVRNVILDTLRGVPNILNYPEPEIFAWEYGESSIRYRVKYWLSDYGLVEQIHDRIVSSLWYAFRRQGIEIPFPIRTLRLSQERPVNESELLREIITELRGVDFLSDLTEEEMRILSNAVRVRKFGGGEILVREGDPGNSFYIIRHGAVEVTAKSADGRPVHLTELTRPAFFGEMALMTGEPRNATIRARTDSEVLEMSREGFNELFKTHPETATKMSEIIAARMTQRRELLDVEHTADGGGGRSSWLLAKMRSIFDI